MTISIFRPPTDADISWHDCKIGDINDCINMEISKYFCGVGTAYFTIPVTSPYADYCTINSFLYIKDYPDSMYIIKNRQTKNDEIKLSCYDLNAFLLDRVTLYDDSKAEDGTEGYDVISGSTETCIKHYVDYNLVNPEDSNRKIPKLQIKDDLGRGLADDKYMSRLDVVDDVVNALCSGAELGYRLKPNFNSLIALFDFDVAEKVDKTSSQTDRNRVIFSKGMRNITTQIREIGITADKNSFYCDTDDIITSAYKDKENIQTGFNRREQYLSLSCELEDVDLYASKEISENYGETDSLEIEAGNPKDYPTMYDVGDIVTVYDKKTKTTVDSVISAVEIKRSGNSHTVKIILGNARPKLLDGIATKGNTTSKNLKDNVPVQAGLGTNVYPANNAEAVTIGATRAEVLKIKFAAKGTTTPILGATIQGTLTTAGTINFLIIYDNTVSCTFSETYSVGSFAKALTLPIFGCAAGSHNIVIAVLSSDASGKVPKGNSYGYIIGSDLAANNAWDGTITIRQKIVNVKIKPYNLQIADITDNVILDADNPAGDSINQTIAPITIAHQKVTLTDIIDTMPNAPIKAYNNDTDTIYIDFYNPILSANISANIDAIEITAVIGTTTSKLSIDSLSLSGLTTLQLNLPTGSITGGTVSIAYTSSIGNLVDNAIGAKVADFVIAFDPIL